MLMKRLPLTLATAATLLYAGTAQAQINNAPKATKAPAKMNYANAFDKQVAGRYEAREKDWRNGAIVYQVFVDRFAPSANLDAKRALYPAPKVLRRWDEQPEAGKYLEDVKVWSHEIDFWGGDLASTLGKLDYVQGLGADVLYLNPIPLAYTNHKYDALDYQQISPEYGTYDDVKKLAAETKRRNMKLVLDGVFNHMGRNSPKFQSAQNDPKSPYRDWFTFGSQYKAGYRGWWNVDNLPELNLENPKVREHLWNGKDSVVRKYLRDGVDGWRLDVAFDIGMAPLDELTRAAHAEKPGSLVVGEIANYPKEWFPAVDGVMHFTLRGMLLRIANRIWDAPTAQRMIERLIRDADYEHILKSWVYLDNHDTGRLATLVPDEKMRRLLQVLQFTLPGSPNLYYGSEVAMTGGDDPEMRGPMAWDRVAANHPELVWTKQLIGVRKQSRALRVGDTRSLEATRLIAFQRHTDRARDAVYVLVNPGSETVKETLLVPDSKAMDGTRLVDAFGQGEFRIQSALLQVELSPQSFRVLTPVLGTPEGYSNYKRVQ